MKLIKTFGDDPDRDLFITPRTLLEDGTVVVQPDQLTEREFECPLLPTAFARNVFRLYSSILYMATGYLLASPNDPIAQYEAAVNTHSYMMASAISHSSYMKDCLNSLHLLMEREPLDTTRPWSVRRQRMAKMQEQQQEWIW